MAKEVIHTGGEDVTVREDTAKAFHGVNWALASVAAFIIIAAVMFLVFFFGASTDGSLETPAQIQNSNANAR